MMTKTTYRGTNNADTGMSDGDLYGREEALGVDIDACRRAASREVIQGLDILIFGSASARYAQLLVRRAVLRLAITIGNQSIAEDYLGGSDLRRSGDSQDREAADRAELNRAVAREYPHPELIANLARIEAEIRDIRA